MNTLKGKLLMVGGVLLVSVAIFTAYQSMGRANAPEDFRSAREKSSELSDKISRASNEITEDLQEVNELDKEKKFVEAHALTGDLLERTEDIRKDALALSEEMEKMLLSLEKVKSQEAKEVALEYVNTRLASISYLLSYTENLKEIFYSLQNKFERRSSSDISMDLQRVNQEVGRINELNREAVELMERFDNLTK